MNLAQSYYNLLVSAHDKAWEGLSWSLEKGRLFEHTNEIVKGRFTPLSEAMFRTLQSLPTVFAYERACRKPAHIGRITGVTHRQDGYGITYELDPHIAPIAPEQLDSLVHALDIEPRYELNRTHWAVKNVALAEVLQRTGLMAARATLSPSSHTPSVFVSYSHDSAEHKAWVAQLALDLRHYGVEILLDQWHTLPGDDLEAFMRRGVTKADYVVLVCTEAYVRKIEDGTGGAGFEHALMMGHLMRQLGTSKFIPVIRQTRSPRALIPGLATRLYVDLSEGAPYPERVQELARAVHKQLPVLPPLGRAPVPPPPLG